MRSTICVFILDHKGLLRVALNVGELLKIQVSETEFLHLKKDLVFSDQENQRSKVRINMNSVISHYNFALNFKNKHRCDVMRFFVLICAF